ncbi:LAFA_0F11210g1_1 [Lachancea sp. 'fantastica']|nr:LAFA_0F11210g1_1 [Lachancea sp. 'fantastica']
MTRVKDTYDRKTFSRQEWKEYVLESALPFDVVGFERNSAVGSDSVAKRTCLEPSIAHLLLNYFVVMSYEESSIRMARELGYVRNNKDASTFNRIYKIKERARVRELIKSGKILEAIEQIYTEFGVQVLEKDRSGIEDGTKTSSDDDDDLHFKLLLLNLIEMIRRHHQSGASPEDSSDFILELIEYSQERLASKADANTQYMKELELVMTLLLFPMEKCPEKNGVENMALPKSLRNLYSLSLRTKIADLVNRKLLESMHPQISAATEDRKFPDLIGFNASDHDAGRYHGMFPSNNDEDAGFGTPFDNPKNLGSTSRTPFEQKPWQKSSWNTTSRRMEQEDHLQERPATDLYKHAEYEARLKQVMKLWAWCENQLHHCGVGVPRVEGGI